MAGGDGGAVGQQEAGERVGCAGGGEAGWQVAAGGTAPSRPKHKVLVGTHKHHESGYCLQSPPPGPGR